MGVYSAFFLTVNIRIWPLGWVYQDQKRVVPSWLRTVRNLLLLFDDAGPSCGVR